MGSADTLTPDIVQDSAQARTDDILTLQQRQKLFRDGLRKRQEGRGLRLKDFILGKDTYLSGVDKNPREKRAQDIDLMCRYFNSDQYSRYDAQGNISDMREAGDFAAIVNVLNGHVEQAFIQIFKTRPQYQIQPDDPDDPTRTQVARMCEALGVKDFNRLMDGPPLQDEIYNTLFAGESYREIFWAPNPRSPKKAKRLKYKQKNIELPATQTCQACNAVIPMAKGGEPAKACPKCGATYLKTNAGGSAPQSVPDGVEEISLGENRLHIPHPLSMQRDLSALTPSDSTFLVERSVLDAHVAAWNYQSEITAEGRLSPEMSIRLDLERSSTQTDMVAGSARGGITGPGRPAFGGGDGVSTHGRKIEQKRHRWKPAEYGWFWIDQDEVLPNGDVIKAGQFLGDYYQSGMKVIIAGETILDIDADNRPPILVQYGKLAGTSSGAGLHKLIPLQDFINDDFSLGQAVKNTVGHPITAIDGSMTYELPGAGQILKINKLPGQSLQDVLHQFPGQTMSDDGTQEKINAAMQFIAKTNTVGSSPGGAPDMRAAAGTAHGIVAMQEQAASGQSGPVDQRIYADKETIIQCLENIQEHCTEQESPEQHRELVKRWGKVTVDAFFECNIRQEMNVIVSAGSDMPKSMAMTQANQVAFGQLAEGAMQAIAQAPAQIQQQVTEWLDSVADSMGIASRLGPGRTDRIQAEDRLNKLYAIEERILAKQPQLAGNPETLAALMHKGLEQICKPLIAKQPGGPMADGPRVFMQDHEAFKDVYKDQLFSQRAESWSQAHKLCVMQLWMDHLEAQIAVQIEQAQLQALVQQEMMPEQPQDPNAANPQEEHQRALEAEELKRKGDEEQKQRDHGREQEGAEADHARAREVAEDEHRRNQEAADAEAQRQALLNAHKGDVQMAVDDNKSENEAENAERFSAFEGM